MLHAEMLPILAGASVLTLVKYYRHVRRVQVTAMLTGMIAGIYVPAIAFQYLTITVPTDDIRASVGFLSAIFAYPVLSRALKVISVWKQP